jgi:hypothetical protein
VPEALGVLNEQHITRPERAGLPARGDLDTAGDADDQLAPLLRLLSVASPGRAAAEQHRGGLPGLGDAHRIRRRVVRGEGNLDILEPSMTILVGEQAGNWDHARHDDTRRDAPPRGQVAEGAELQVAAHVSGTRG